jgi:hypothetical protein
VISAAAAGELMVDVVEAAKIMVMAIVLSFLLIISLPIFRV